MRLDCYGCYGLLESGLVCFDDHWLGQLRLIGNLSLCPQLDAFLGQGPRWSQRRFSRASDTRESRMSR